MTSRGAELAAHGQRIHEIVALAADRIERVAVAERRILRVVAFRAHPMIEVVYYQLARRAAGLRVELDALSAGEAIDRVRGGRSEALFGYGLESIDGDERPDDLDTTTIVEVPMRVMLHQEHPCANADAVALVDLHEEPWVVADEGTVLHAHTRVACQAAGFEPDIRFAVDRDSVTRLVALHAGVTLVCATTSTGALPVTLVPPVDELRLAGYLAWRHDSPHGAALTDLAHSLRALYRSWVNRIVGSPVGARTPVPEPPEPTCAESHLR